MYAALDDTNKDKCDKLDWADLIAMIRVEIGKVVLENRSGMTRVEKGKVVLENRSHFEGLLLELEKNTI